MEPVRWVKAPVVAVQWVQGAGSDEAGWRKERRMIFHSEVKQEHSCGKMATVLEDPLANETRIIFDNYRGRFRWRIAIEDWSLNECADSFIDFCPYCGTELGIPASKGGPA